MADNGYQIDINFSGGGAGGGGSSSNYLDQVLVKLNGSVDKLVDTLNKFNSAMNKPGMNRPFDKTPAFVQGAAGQSNEQKIKSLFSTAVVASVAVTTLRWMNANANAIMSQAGNRGAFAGAGIMGGANQAYGTYVGNMYDIERQRIIARNFAIGEGVGGLAGGAAGIGLGALSGNPLAAFKGGAGGAGLGAAVGNYETADRINANIQQAMLIEKAYAQREAGASVSEWRTGFSRFGLARQNTLLAGSNITGGDPISAHISGAFDAKYGTVNGAFNPNYNAILNKIVPYLQSNPLDSKNGDLNKVAQNFLKAGFAVEQFSDLTMQGAQYQALTGKNLQQFSEDVKASRAKFGDAYDLGSNQTALNLMAMGYSSSDARNIAFQSKYNSGILSSVGQFTSMTAPSYYSAQALGRPLGFDLFNTIKTGQFQGNDRKRQDLSRQIRVAEGGGGLSSDLMILQAQGYNIGQVSQWLQPKVSPLSGSVNEKAGYSDAQTQAMKDLTDGVRNALNNVGEMVVNATNVTIYNSSPGTLQSGLTQQSPHPSVSFANSPLVHKIGGMFAIKKH